MFQWLLNVSYILLKNREELKRWFIQQEVDLFRYKLQKASTDSNIIQRFLTDNQLNYVPVIFSIFWLLNSIQSLKILIRTD